MKWLVNMGFYIILLLAEPQCDEETKYRNLSFFFDGVPLPASMDTTRQQMEADSAGMFADVPSDTLIQKRTAPVIVNVIHPPYKEKKCALCHEGEGGQRLSQAQGILCATCHEQFQVMPQYVHGPVAVGKCLVCHNPHITTRPRLLTRDNEEVCTFCHTTIDRTKEYHQYGEEGTLCYTCHSPHFSDDSPFFLLSDSKP